MTIAEVRKRYLDYFKRRGHVVIPSASLVPENDPTTLFTGSGMQPLVPYLLGKEHPQGSRLVDSQKCFRAEDIEEVGDNRHTTFFEMLGNWSLGDYFKEEQLGWFFSFLTDELGLDPQKLYVTVFIGDGNNNIPKDTESSDIWKKLFAGKNIDARVAEIGSEEDGYKRGMKESERIFYYDAAKNWWSRAGKPENMPAGEPGGPDSEVFYDFGIPHDPSFGEHCHPNCDCGRFMEIGNSVFMEYQKQEDGSFAPLPRKNVDFGGGLERITAATNNNPDVFAVDVFANILSRIEMTYGTGWNYDAVEVEQKKAMRVVADHLRGAVFMIADGVEPSNVDRGYFVRRLIRRAVFSAYKFAHGFSNLYSLVDVVVESYKDAYPYLTEKADYIHQVFEQEETRFMDALERGEREFEKIAAKSSGTISGEDAFTLFSSFGLPIDAAVGLAAHKGLSVDTEGFKEAMKRHREVSRKGAEQKFKGGLADASEQTTRLHTATHLLLAGLRKHLGDDVHQAGSNITAERTRFDFTYPEKVSREILDQVEQYVNAAIAAKAERTVENVPKEEARAAGIEGSFWERYPDIVDVYMFKDAKGRVWSRELCGGPHVNNTAEISEGGKIFRITKEEAVSAGVRRIKATLT